MDCVTKEIQYYDFGRVLKVMELLDWKWAGYEVMFEFDLVNCVLNLFHRCYEILTQQDETSVECATGGFRVKLWYDKDNLENCFDAEIKFEL